ncbi:MAG: hypothetical protein U9N81_05975 [Bacillota bacterium]|nr:hypothetical protein [Bacillota bacterium]
MSHTMSQNQIRSIGIAALTKTLGPVGMTRFLQQFDRGVGDYTNDRVQWLEQFNLDEICKSIDEMPRKDKR